MEKYDIGARPGRAGATLEETSKSKVHVEFGVTIPTDFYLQHKQHIDEALADIAVHEAQLQLVQARLNAAHETYLLALGNMHLALQREILGMPQKPTGLG